MHLRHACCIGLLTLAVLLSGCGPAVPTGALGVSFGDHAQDATATWGSPCGPWNGWVGEEIGHTVVKLQEERAALPSDDPRVAEIDNQIAFLRESLEMERMGGSISLRYLEIKMRERQLQSAQGGEPELQVVRAQLAMLGALSEEDEEPSLDYIDLRLQETRLSILHEDEHPRMAEIREELAALEASPGPSERGHRFEVCATGPIQAYGAPAAARVLREGEHFEALQLTWSSCAAKHTMLREQWQESLGLEPQLDTYTWPNGEFVLVERDDTADTCTLTVAGARWGQVLDR